VFSVESAPRLYNEDPRPAERIIWSELRVESPTVKKRVSFKSAAVKRRLYV
jgi:hypothetical protein